jgi:ParB family chromosome partitioning protein
MEIIEIDVDKIKPNPTQPRKEFDETKLKELAESISRQGLINPINVVKKDDSYELISGERRLKAHKIANIKTIKAIVRDIDEKDRIIQGLIENIQRENLTEYEKALNIREIADRGYKPPEIAKMLGVSLTYIHDLLDLTDEEYSHLAASVKDKKITLHTFQDIRKIGNKELEIKLLDKKINEKIGSTQIRDYVKIIKNSPKEVTKAVMKNELNLEQGKQLSKVKDKKLRDKLIKTHKSIKRIDKNLDKSVLKKHMPKKIDLSNVVKTKEIMAEFRSKALESQRINQATIKVLLRCKAVSSLMDTTQLKKLKHYVELYSLTLENTLKLSQNIQSKI